MSATLALVNTELKTCIWCKKSRPLLDFSVCRANKDGKQSRCKSCDNAYTKEARFKRGKEAQTAYGRQYRLQRGQNFDFRLKALLYTSRQRAKEKEREHTLTLDDLKSIYPHNGLCPIFGFKLEWNSKGFRETSPSIDRIDSSKGYTIDNVQIISWKANRIKSYATIEELETVINYMKSGG